MVVLLSVRMLAKAVAVIALLTFLVTVWAMPHPGDHRSAADAVRVTACERTR
jgi:hypothetical protein